MIEISYLTNFLDSKQKKIDDIYYKNINDYERNYNISENKNNNMNQYKNENKNEIVVDIQQYKVEKYKINLLESFDILFKDYINNFYYDSKIYKNKSPVFTLLNSIFCISDEYFNLKNENEKEDTIKFFIKKIDEDLFQKDLYNKFNYNKNRKFNKYNIQEVLKNSYYFKYCDNFDLLKEYLSDYLGINIYILFIKNKILDLSKSKFFMSKYYNNNYNKYLPSYIIILDNEIYKPVTIKNSEDDSGIIKYSEYSKLIDNLWDYLNINELYNELYNNEKSENLIINYNINSNNYNQTNNNETNNNETNNNETNNNETNNNETNNNETNNNTINNDNNLENNNGLLNNDLENNNSNDASSLHSDLSDNKKYNINNLKKLKLDELKLLCDQHNISMFKKSEKTSKDIKKIKSELIEELLILI